MPDMSQIPPQMQQMLAQQQGGMSGGDITSILAQLSQMSPDEVSAALAQLGVNIAPEQLQQAAEDWVDRAAEDASGNKAAPTTAPEAEGEQAPVQEQDDESAEPTPDDEAAEGEAETPSAASTDNGSTPMARRGGSSGAPSNQMDELVSAAMMQGAAGNPNAAVPPALARGAAPMRAAGVPNRAAPTPDPRMASMIANLYRQQSAAPRGVPVQAARGRTRG